MYFQQTLGRRTTAYLEKSSLVNFCGKRKEDQAKKHFIIPYLIFFSSSSFFLLQNVSQIFGQITTASGHTATVFSIMNLQTLSDQVSETG